MIKIGTKRSKYISLSILQGGRIRQNFPVDASSVYTQGSAIVINANGALTQYTGPAGVVGLAMETAVSSTVKNPTANTSIVTQGQVGSILLGEATVTTNQLSGAGGWTIGGTVYAVPGGALSYVNISGTDIGKAISNPASNGQLTLLFRPTV